MTNLPNNLESIEDTRIMGTAGMVFLSESDEQPETVFNDDSGNSLSVYSDGSAWLSANVSEIYPSFQDYLLGCVGDDDQLTAQLRQWAVAVEEVE